MTELNARKPLRTWPVPIIWALLVVALGAGPFLGEPIELVAMGAGAVSAVLITIWWLLFSRARWFERIAVPVVTFLAVYSLTSVVDQSIDGGAQGYLEYILGTVTCVLAVSVWAVVTRGHNDRLRRLLFIPALLVLGVGPMLMMRTEGVMGGGFIMHFRWTPTPEDLLLAKAEADPTPQPAAAAKPAPPPVAVAPKPATESAAVPSNASTPPPAVAPVAEEVVAAAEWPGFRGPNRDGVIHHVQIKTDWTQSPPVEMWRRPIGPGWSSFSVRGDLLYTQEQRGDDEIVACYRVSTGEPVWRHRDPIRFYESNGGAGPRGTPTIHGTRIFSMGATGRLNALDAATGKRLWAHDSVTDTAREIPLWGISSSPLVVGDTVIVAPNGRLAGYDVITGAVRWIGPTHGGSYSSPHLLTIDGVTQVIILSGPGVVSVNPADGKELWSHTWDGGAIVQPAILENGDILIGGISMTGGLGLRRLAIKHAGDAWQVEERWTSNGLKPYFNDLVIHKGYAFGFDGAILSAIDLADGKRKWKGGRYGNGQMVLLADQDLLLVTSEEGELVLVSATPDQYKEIAKIPVFDAKTWNHPVIVGDTLLLRNGEEMAAFKLPMATPVATAAR